jgi:hypothetical protein
MAGFRCGDPLRPARPIAGAAGAADPRPIGGVAAAAASVRAGRRRHRNGMPVC